jgi:hypothetical protein
MKGYEFRMEPQMPRSLQNPERTILTGTSINDAGSFQTFPN